MVDIPTLLPELKKLVTDLSEDLLARSTSDAKIDAGLREAFQQIEKGGRTAQAFEVWREDYLDQVAVAWVLACVFVRFMEDNHLIDECWLAGEGDRRRLAEDNHELFFRQHPHDTEREYFHHVFKDVGQIPAARELYAEGKTPLWAVSPSGDAAMSLLKFWREIDAESGHLKRLFQVENGDTRFLGDLYQELSEKAKKKYALLQTPVFVEEFILDRTLNPAIDEFGLEKVRMIDPTCGSGHFLLGGFARLFDLWIKQESNEIKAAQKALDGVWGVDINPFAVAIARFRLIVAAVQVCGIRWLEQAPAWQIHLATGDSLLFGNRWSQTGEKKAEQQFFSTDEESWAPEIYACEDKQAISDVLGQQYHAVVGNPPYITPKDARLNQAYRDRFPKVCYRQYSLGVPFCERFFDICVTSGSDKTGYVGMITANSFMKREFGKKLIEEFLPKIDLTHVIDTSGAYIPGHGTPTVILFGRNRRPLGETVRAVLGIRGEPSTPQDASQGLVWQSIVKQIDVANAQDEFTSTADVSRSTFANHPWSIGGGGAADLKQQLEANCQSNLQSIGCDIGFLVITGEDNCLVLENDVPARLGVRHVMPLVLGDEVRDWSLSSGLVCLWPNDRSGERLPMTAIAAHLRFCWPYRVTLQNRKAFGVPVEQKGIPWWALRELYSDRLRTPLSIVFAFVAWQNHFVLDRGGKVFNRSAPIIKLPADATEDDHLALLGLLNSSTACFWMKQVTQIKTQTTGMDSQAWQLRREFDGTKLKVLPIPDNKPLSLSRSLDEMAQQLCELTADRILKKWTKGEGLKALIEKAEGKAGLLRGMMVAIQEELDWECYLHYGLLADDLRYNGDHLPGLKLGERAFEIVMARQMENGELQTTWFERHDSTPITSIPAHWPVAYRRLVERRIELIESNKEVRLIEKPEYKRRWHADSRKGQEQRALRNWLLERLEGSAYWPDATHQEPHLRSAAQLADKASSDHEFLEVAAIHRSRQDFDVAALVAELVEAESVPFLPVLRYTAAGLRKREVWESTWDLQREQDAGKNVGNIPVPPKYAPADFLKTDFWRLRGKLDVPKERWISYPHCSTESDPSLVIGWAGWNHLQQATALVAYYDARKREGWDASRLTSLLAGLDQLLPWIHQWHPEVDPEFGETAGQSFQTMLEHDAHELGLTLEDIRNWTPPEKARKTRTARQKKEE